MKKFITFFALAALALVGCKKEIATGVLGGDQTVTFSVVAADATKADVTAIPSTINKCVAVIRMYDGNNHLFNDVYAKPECTKDGESYKFSADLMGGQKYEITVLLYTDGVYSVDGKLESVERANKSARNNPNLDIFSASVTYTAGEATPLIIARRPFAQLNLITTDLVENFEPTIALKYTAPKTFNAVTGEVSGTQVYETVGTYTYAYAPSQCTLSSDYIFASNEKSLISVEMTATKTGAFVRTFDNLPLQRNYKTNVIGKLLTVDAPFTVQVNADWYIPANDIQWQNAENIAVANALLAAAAAGENMNIKVNMPKDAAAQKITFTPKNSNTNTSFKFEDNFASSSAADRTITFTKDADATVMPASITVEAPAGTNLVFEKESHVVINGTDYGTITGSFTANTLVISKGVTVGTLTILRGGLEIHGTVNAVTAIAEGAEVIVRDCEGLSQEVYDELKAFIDPEYIAEQVNGKWNIFMKPAAVAKIGETLYKSLAEANEAVQPGQTITILADIEDAGRINLKSGVTLAGEGHKISGNSAIYINAAGGGFIRNLNFENIHNTTVPSASDITKYELPADKVGTLSAIYAEDLTGKVAVTDCTFDNIDWDAIQITPKDGCTIDIVNNTFMHTNTETSQLRYVHIETTSYIDAVVTVTDNKFYDSKNEFVISDLGVYKVRKSKTTKLSGNWLETISNYDMTYPEMIYPARSQADVDVDDICPAAKKVVTPIKFYDTLQEAVDELVDIQLLKNTDENVTVPAGFNKQIQMGGFRIQSTITNNGTVDLFSDASDEVSTGTIVNNGTLTLRYCGYQKGLQVKNTGKLMILTSGTSADPAVGDLSNISNMPGGIVEISGGTFSTRPYNDWILWGYEAVDNGDGTFTVQKRTFADDAEALAGGAIAKYTKSGVTEYINTLANGSNSNLYFLKDITEDVVRTGSAAYFYAESFKYCGSLDATGKAVYFKTGKAEFNSLKSAALYIGSTGKECAVKIHDGKVTGKITIYGPAVLEIDGGSFTNTPATAAIDFKTGATLIIKGGTFKSAQFKNYISDGYEAVDNGDGTWSVVKTE